MKVFTRMNKDISSLTTRGKYSIRDYYYARLLQNIYVNYLF